MLQEELPVVEIICYILNRRDIYNVSDSTKYHYADGRTVIRSWTNVFMSS